MAKTPQGRSKTNGQKPYSDDRNKGRRTGKTVKEVDRDDDGFENYDEVLAVNASPRSFSRQTPRTSTKYDESDDDEELDMSIAEPEATYGGSEYTAPIPRPAPSSVSYSRSISRRTGPVDFDAIPSPSKTSGHNRSNITSSLAEISITRSRNIGSRPKPTPRYSNKVREPSNPEIHHSDNALDSNMDVDNGSPELSSHSLPSPVSKGRKTRSITSDGEDDDERVVVPSPSRKHASNTSAVRRKITTHNASNEEPEVVITPHRSTTAKSPKSLSVTASGSKRPPKPLLYNDSDSDAEIAVRARSSQAPAAAISDDDDSVADNDFGGNYDDPEDNVPIDVDYDAGLVENDDAAQPTEISRHEDDEGNRVSKKVTSTGKSKSKDIDRSQRERSQLSPVVEEDEQMEQEISSGLQGIGEDDDEDQEEEPPRKVTKKRTPKEPKKARISSSSKTKSSPSKKLKRPLASTTNNPRLSLGDRSDTGEVDGAVRRSKRARHAPLEYWRGERIILGRADDGRPRPCPVLKGFLTIPKEMPEPLGAKRRKRGGSNRARSTSRTASVTKKSRDVSEQPLDLTPPEAGWDDDTPQIGEVYDWIEQGLVQRRIAVPFAKMQPVQAGPDKEYFYEKVFGEEDFMACGVITIPIGGQKNVTRSRDNLYAFFVHTGAVKASVNGADYTVAPGGSFLVPRGNKYGFQNISERECTIWFAQARKDEKETADDNGTSVGDSVPPSRLSMTSSAVPSRAHLPYRHESISQSPSKPQRPRSSLGRIR